MNRLSKEQKLLEVEKQLTRLFDDLKNKALKEYESAMLCGAVPDYMFEQDSHLLAIAVLDSVLAGEGQAWRRIRDERIRRDMRNIVRCLW